MALNGRLTRTVSLFAAKLSIVPVASELRGDNTILVIHWRGTTGSENAITAQPLAGDQVEALQKAARTRHTFTNNDDGIQSFDELGESAEA